MLDRVVVDGVIMVKLGISEHGNKRTVLTCTRMLCEICSEFSVIYWDYNSNFLIEKRR